MSLSARVARARGADQRSNAPDGKQSGQVHSQSIVEFERRSTDVVTDHVSGTWTDLTRAVRADVLVSLGEDFTEGKLDEDALRHRTGEAVSAALLARAPELPPKAREEISERIIDDTLGLGPLERLLRDPSISEIMVNGAGAVYVERSGVLALDDTSFRDDDHLRRTIDRIVARVGRRIDESSPMVDARLRDGSRINAIIPPVCVDGAALTVRKFRRDALTMDDLVGLESVSPEAAEFLSLCVKGRLNLLVSGGTGTGKTTLLGALSTFIGEDERIITIEDAAELQLDHDHLVRLESRPPHAAGGGEVSIRDLLRNALRMRPDRIIVGEVRDAAALDMLQAMTTGHDGSLGTVHASTARDALRRLETMALFAGLDLPVRAVRDQIAAGIDVIVHLRRGADGVRRIHDIVEVVGLEGEVIALQDVFTRAGDSGPLVPTGFRPRFWDRIAPDPSPIDGATPVTGGASEATTGVTR